MKYIDLGPLEKGIIAALFEHGERTNAELVEDINPYVDVKRSSGRRSLTTVATVTNRLYEKGLLSRKMRTGKGTKGIGKYFYRIKDRNIEKKFAEEYVKEFIRMFKEEGGCFFKRRS